jgi:hypothetical protein
METRRTLKPALGDNASYSSSSDIFSWDGEAVEGNGTWGEGQAESPRWVSWKKDEVERDKQVLAIRSGSAKCQADVSDVSSSPSRLRSDPRITYCGVWKLGPTRARCKSRVKEGRNACIQPCLSSAALYSHDAQDNLVIPWPVQSDPFINASTYVHQLLHINTHTYSSNTANNS